MTMGPEALSGHAATLVWKDLSHSWLCHCRQFASYGAWAEPLCPPCLGPLGQNQVTIRYQNPGLEWRGA